MVSRIEHQVAERFERAHCVIVGSGTSALYCALAQLRANLDTEDPLVLYPNITCETAINAGIFAGFRPVFCDSRAENGLMSGETVRDALASDRVHAIVPTHIFGHIVDIPALESALPRGLAVVEDAAQGYGGTLPASRVGSMGASSVLSFGAGKLLECGGGGALLCDDASLAREYSRIASTLQDDRERASTHRVALMREMMSAGKLFRRSRPALVTRQREILREHRDGYLSPATAEVVRRISVEFSHLDAAIDVRVAVAQALDDALSGIAGLRVPKRDGAPVLWRHTVYVDRERRNGCIEALNAAGIRTSMLFPPCSRKFLADDLAFPESESHASAVINIIYPQASVSSTAFVSTVVHVLRAKLEGPASGPGRSQPES